MTNGNDSIGVGVIGFGKVGESQHCKYAEETPEFRVAAVADGSDERRAAAKEKFEANVYGSVDEILKDDRVELVVVATPPVSHCEITLKAIEAGKHVIVEKPFSMTGADAKQMVDAAAAKGVILTSNQNRRWDHDYLTVRKAIADGLLGDVYSIESRWMHFGESWATWGVEGFNPSWRVQRQWGGGMVYDYACHLGDQILRMVDSPVQSVFADCQSRIWSEEVDDHFKCFVRFANDVTAWLEATNNARVTLPRWYVLGDRASLIAGPVMSSEIKLVTDEGDQMLDVVREPAGVIYRNLAGVLREGEDLAVKPEHVLQTMQLVDAIFESAEKGASVTL